MIRVLISVIAIALTSTTMIRSAYANDSQSAALSSQAATGSDVDDVQNKAPSNKENGRWLLRGPKAIAGCCAGFVIGTPICFARKLPQETKDGAHGIVGSIVKDNNNKFLLVPATFGLSASSLRCFNFGSTNLCVERCVHGKQTI